MNLFPFSFRISTLKMPQIQRENIFEKTNTVQ